MTQVKAGSLAGELLKNAGVSYLFGIPGGHVYPLMEGCKEAGIPFIGVRNEMNAAFAAEGWALTTGKLGACTGTAGPGVTNLITGMGNAKCGGYPVLYLGGRAKLAEFDVNQLQDFETLPVVSSICKYSKAVYDPARLPEYMQRCATMAISGRPGPVYFEMARNYMEGEIETDELPKLLPILAQGEGRTKADPAAVAKAVELIDKAERPIVMAGGGAWWSQAQDALKAFVEKTGVPFYTRNAARGMISDFHPLYGGLAYNHPVLLNTLPMVDLIVIVGTRPGYTLHPQHLATGVPIIRIDIDPAEITSMVDVTVPLVGDARAVLEQLTEGCAEAKRDAWLAAVNEVKSNVMMSAMPGLMCEDTPIHPMRLLFELYQYAAINNDTIFCIDGGDAATWGSAVLPATGPGQHLSLGATCFGPLGVGMGYAMASKLAHPEKTVIMFTGDGAFGYNVMEYDTCIRYGINIITVILNDKQWGMILRSEAKKTEGLDPIGLQLRETHYEEIVTALGGYGEFVTDPNEIGPALQRAIESGVPACINVMTDPQYGPNF